MSDKIELYEGEAVVYTITAKRDGTAIPLTDHMNSGAVTFSLWDDDPDVAIIAADVAVTSYADAANGQVTITITTTHTTLAAGAERHGKWRLKLNNGAGIIEKLTPGEFIVHTDAGQA